MIKKPPTPSSGDRNWYKMSSFGNARHAMDDDPSSHSHVRLGVNSSAHSGAQALA